MINKRRALLSLVAGALITALGSLPVPFADFTLWPGSVLASPFWPQGVHSDFDGPFSIIAMLAVVWGGALAAWSTLSYLAASLFGKSRAA